MNPAVNGMEDFHDKIKDNFHIKVSSVAKLHIFIFVAFAYWLAHLSICDLSPSCMSYGVKY